MARSKIRENQVQDADFMSEQEHADVEHLFVSLADTPSTVSGYGGKYVVVKIDETGLEFTTATGVGIDNIVDDTSPELGGNLDTNQKNIILQPIPTSDHEVNGDVVAMTVDENGVGFAAVLHLDSDGNFILADADSLATMPCRALTTVTGTGSMDVLFRGFVRDDSLSLTPGAVIYVSQTAGGISQTKPIGQNKYEQQIGVATHANRYYFDPQEMREVTFDRAVFGGGTTGSNSNVIDYISISIPGQATDFGDLSLVRRYLTATSNGTNDRGVFGGGLETAAVNIIDYITISTPCNAIDFGDLATVMRYLAACSNNTNDRSVFGGGYDAAARHNIIEYITISTLGNATNFGDLTVVRAYLAATSNGTGDRGVIGGGDTGSNSDVIDYITISTPGDATNFGDLTVARYNLGATSNGTNDRAVFGGGTTGSETNVIDYVTISSTGNAANFGDLTVARRGLAATSNGIADRAVFGGGTTGSVSNVIDYVPISTPGDATDFGDLTAGRDGVAATSNC